MLRHLYAARMPKLTVVISQGQSASPAKRELEEDLVGALLIEPASR